MFGILVSGFVVAEISVQSPQKLVIFIIERKSFPDQSIQKAFILIFAFESRNTDPSILQITFRMMEISSFWGDVTTAAVLAKISFRSPRKLSIFIMKRNDL